MNNKNMYEGFTQALFFSGSVAIPKLLLNNYAEIGLNNNEMILIIYLLSEDCSKGIPFEQIRMIAGKMNMSAKEIQSMIESFENRGLLQIEVIQKSGLNDQLLKYYFNGLIDQLFEIWGINHYRQMEAESANIEKNTNESMQNDENLIKKIAEIFENELGRPITGFEFEHIEKWLMANYSEELIIEALRRGVSAGVRSFRYLDSILREWEKKGIKTKLEVEVEDVNFQSRHQKKGKSTTENVRAKEELKNKYNNIYL
ncbi:MAG: DnaD domain protein [Eubacteriales bacterium]